MDELKAAINAAMDRFFSFYNLRVTIIFFGLFLLSFVWLGLYFKIASERDMEIIAANKEAASFTHAVKEHTVRTIQSADQAALFLKYEYENKGPEMNIPRYIAEGRFANLPFVLLGIIDEQGDLVLSSQDPFVSSNLKDREHFQVHKNADSGNLFISKPVLGRSSGKWAIQMTRRINKPDGSFGGVAVVSVNPYYFSEFYRHVNLSENASITLVGRDGIVLARQSGLNATVGQDLTNNGLMNQLAENQAGSYFETNPADGVRSLYSFEALREYPLVVMVGIDENQILRGWKQRVTGYYTIAGLVTLIITVFIMILLGVSVRQKRAETALKQGRDELEMKVVQRTQELIAANLELAAMNEQHIAINEELQNSNRELEREAQERKRTAEALYQKTEEVRHMAYYDMLTGLPNRAYLNNWLEEELAGARRGKLTGAFVFLDLDELKIVNDTFGHKHGDALIITAGSRIVAEAGKNAFVARIGGDEFIVVLPGENNLERVSEKVQKILTVLGKEQEVQGVHFHTSASAGIAIYPGDGDTVEEIFKNADNAMYAAKRSGKNCWRYYQPAMQAEAYEKMVLTNSLRQAVARNELQLYYQPQMLVDGVTIAGFEALLRWNSPEHGSVSPAVFIPLAEQSGLIHAIGRWVLKEACCFARRLDDMGWKEPVISVNISAYQLADKDFIDVVRGTLQEAVLDPRRLELEITETALMASLEDATRKLLELRLMGIGLALDDFGVGYSSLNYLRHLPVNKLKIDKTFIDTIAAEHSMVTIISSVIQMAHALNIAVVAEGVETEWQVKYLAAKGCDLIQGFVNCRPLPETAIIEYLDTIPPASGINQVWHGSGLHFKNKMTKNVESTRKF